MHTHIVHIVRDLDLAADAQHLRSESQRNVEAPTYVARVEKESYQKSNFRWAIYRDGRYYPILRVSFCVLPTHSRFTGDFSAEAGCADTREASMPPMKS